MLVHACVCQRERKRHIERGGNQKKRGENRERGRERGKEEKMKNEIKKERER